MSRSRNILKALPCVAALAFVGLTACDEPSPPPSYPANVVLTVSDEVTVQVTRQDVDLAAEILAFASPEGMNADGQRRLALREVILPRAAIHASHPLRREEAFAKAGAIAAGLEPGQAHPEEVVKTGDLDLFGPLVVGTAIALKEGEWSDAIETAGSFMFVRPMVPTSRRMKQITLGIVTVPFAPGITSHADLERTLDECVLHVVDERYGELIPERIVHLMNP